MYKGYDKKYFYILNLGHLGQHLEILDKTSKMLEVWKLWSRSHSGCLNKILIYLRMQLELNRSLEKTGKHLFIVASV